jgi:uncharacterized membrane protein YcaP (DUF421 family)
MDALTLDPSAIVRTLVVGVVAYLALVAMLRISGKRTLSQLNAFDFVVTVALGSTLATTVVSTNTGLLQGLAAFAVLIGMQYAITWASQRSALVARLAKSEPTALAYRGRLASEALRQERILPEEVAAALREHGVSSVKRADLVVLETDGTISVVPWVSEAGSDEPDGRQLRSAADDDLDRVNHRSGPVERAWSE